MEQESVPLGPRLVRLAAPLVLALLAAGLLLATRHLTAISSDTAGDAGAAGILSAASAGASGTAGGLAHAVGPVPRYNPRAVLPTEASARLALVRVPVESVLRRGETFGQVLSRFGVSAQDAHAAVAELAAHVSPRSLRMGNRYVALFNPDSTLASLQFDVAGDGRLAMRRGAGQAWQFAWDPCQRSSDLRVVRGELAAADGSIESAIRRAGGAPGLAYRMADALQWDLDFHRDLRRGDRFQVLYEAMQVDGKQEGVGRIVALVYENRERRHEVYGYGDSGTFYDGEGRPLRKMFLRSPLRFTHVTSAFSQSRFHPVLNEYRPHYGVDYSAPVGTPVEVTASGVVIAAGWDGGGGNVVKVQNGPDYVTAYLHLSRFAPGVHPGAHVRQGDVIAYTGMTGLATGPHLDYRVKYRGNWIDPLTLKGVRDEPISRAALASFQSWRTRLRTGLDSGVVPAGLKLPAPRQPETRLAAAAGGHNAAASAGAIAR